MLPDKASLFVAGMSDIARSKKDIAIIGAGCASLSLAAKANELLGSKLPAGARTSKPAKC